MVSKSKIYKIIAAIVLIGLLCLIAGLFVIRSYAQDPIDIDDSKIIFIPGGVGISGVAKVLFNNGIIKDDNAYKLFPYIYQIYGGGISLKAGEYEFKGETSIIAIIKQLQDGKSYQRKWTIIEGKTAMEILHDLSRSLHLSGGLPASVQEGRMMPDTYYHEHGDSRRDIIKRAVRAHDNFVRDSWRLRDKSIDDVIRNRKQAVILASIVEKETGMDDERDKIAAVFINRLRKKMRLQADPTVIYAITQGRNILDREISKADLKLRSPYNTYVIKGLPVGAICNPSKEAIEAVLHPAKTDDLYFVADNYGGHYFAKTLEEHNKNVQKYRKSITTQ